MKNNPYNDILKPHRKFIENTNKIMQQQQMVQSAIDGYKKYEHQIKITKKSMEDFARLKPIIDQHEKIKQSMLNWTNYITIRNINLAELNEKIQSNLRNFNSNPIILTTQEESEIDGFLEELHFENDEISTDDLNTVIDEAETLSENAQSYVNAWVNFIILIFLYSMPVVKDNLDINFQEFVTAFVMLLGEKKSDND